jgi:hypothetical protein
MSSLDSGFVRQTVGYGNNDFFPITSLLPDKHGMQPTSFKLCSDETSYLLLGQDPIIGGPPAQGSSNQPTPAKFLGQITLTNGDQVDLRLVGANDRNIAVSGFAKVTDQGAQPPPGEPNPFFVTSRGGEYFFVPSISTLTTWANSTGP